MRIRSVALPLLAAATVAGLFAGSASPQLDAQPLLLLNVTPTSVPVGADWSALAVVRADGSGLRLLTDANHFIGGAAWSPNGQRIVYERGNSTTDTDLWMMNADGSGQHLLIGGAGTDENPTWTPDGRKVMFDSTRAGNHELFSIDAGGRGLRQLTRTPGDESMPQVSPDGKTITADVELPDTHNATELLAVNGSKRRLLQLGSSLQSVRASWSPDSRRLVLVGSRPSDDYTDIWVSNVDGSGARNISRSASTHDNFPKWSPDGRRIVWDSTTTSVSNSTINDHYSIVARSLVAGASVTLASGGNDEYPSWSPDGRLIAYTHYPPDRTAEVRVVPSVGGRFRTVSGGTLRYAYGLEFQPGS